MRYNGTGTSDPDRSGYQRTMRNPGPIQQPGEQPLRYRWIALPILIALVAIMLGDYL
jgi:hypothetical protein